jgi:hypothetical protein
MNWLAADLLIYETITNKDLDHRDRLRAASLAQRTLPTVLRLTDDEG